MSAAMVRKLIRARGIVQGVGFRPFVYRLARAHGLTGWVANSSAGVTAEVEGDSAEVELFLGEFREQAPVLSQIDAMSVDDIALAGDGEFCIRESGEESGQFVLVPPDIATCEECRRDFTDPANRRYQYPFTNCTNCGPRYTIIEDIPYDRPATTMSVFPMCEACRAEYENPADRRFHAQPNACPVCGPWLELWDGGSLVAERQAALEQVRGLLRSGRIVAIKGLGGFHLACNAEDDGAVRRLRERKRRSDKPFALMAPNMEQVERFCRVSEAERAALLSPRRPIVIMDRRPEATISAAVAPGNNTVGIMLPYTPLHHLLFDEDLRILVMTSGNLSEEPIVSRNEEVRPRLGGLADSYLLHNRGIRTRVDDSVVRVYARAERVVRRSRGFAPHSIDLGMPVPQVLATGAELKYTFCLTKDHYAILSQHIGDLENYETLEFFEETLAHMRRFFRVEPVVVAHDLHPGYLSTRIAQGMSGVALVGVQHHHAHIAACMAENRIRDKAIGVAFDGTGYGTDGQVWGGEFLVCDYKAFERRAHIRYVPMAGGDMAIREPWRMALAWLREVYGAEMPDLPFLARVPERKRNFVDAMLARGVQTVGSSSCGRLFDAVAAILGLRLETNFEGQAAIELECIGAPGVEDSYPFDLEEMIIDFRPTIKQIVADMKQGLAPGVISALFHNTVAAVVVEVCRRIRTAEHLNKVCLSGGTFQNRRLTERCLQLLSIQGFEVYLHSRVPANDGGIALGQAVIGSNFI
jgi:hydrogenase maturation protein HypF